MTTILDYNFDDELIAAVQQGTAYRLKVYRSDAVRVVLGRGSKIDGEVNVEVCLRDNVPIYRRKGGGCTVVLDPGNLIVSLALALPGFGSSKRYLNQITSWLVNAFHTLGYRNLYSTGISDLALDDRKVSGSCVYRSRGFLYYSASILVEAQLELLDRYLRHPPREPEYRRHRSHREFVRNVSLLNGDSLETLLPKLETVLGRSIEQLLVDI